MTNSIREVQFSDAQSVSNTPVGLLTLVYTADGGETSFQDDRLINASVTNLSLDGETYTPVTNFSTATKKEFKHDSDAGSITFHTGLPAMEPDEDSVVNYVPGAAVPFDVTEPVLLDEAKAWMKVEVDDDDVIIAILITAARHICEGYTCESWVQRTVTAIVNNSLGDIRLPYGPVRTISNVYDYNGDELDSDNYTLRGETVKRVCAPVCDYLKLVYTAGFTAITQDRKTALLMQTAWLYQHRGDALDNNTMSPDAKLILSPYRTVV